MEFFKYDSICNVNFSIYEKLVPVLIIIMCIVVASIYRKKLNLTTSGDKLKKTIFIIYIMTFLSDYIFMYCQYGLNIYNLPLELCTFGAVLSIISLINCNEKIVCFLEVVSLPAALMAMVSPATGGDYKHLQYYLFMINHGFTVFIPAYYVFVEHKLCKLKNIFQSIYILICISLNICLLNTVLDTSYFFLSLTKNPYSFGIIGALGDAPLYILKFTILAIMVLLVWGSFLILVGHLIIKLDARDLKIKKPYKVYD